MSRHIVRVEPIVSRKFQGACRMPYPGRPGGCPNFDHKRGCPSGVPLFNEVFRGPVHAVFYRFNLEAFGERMLARNPKMTRKQSRCLLYWQPRARKHLRELVAYTLEWFRERNKRRMASVCPEALGVDVFTTMRNAGVELEWPVEKWVTLVAFVARPRDGYADTDWWHMIGGAEYQTEPKHNESSGLMTFRKIGEALDMHPAYAHAIYEKALRKLRHPRNRRVLRDFIDPSPNDIGPSGAVKRHPTLEEIEEYVQKFWPRLI